MAHPIVGLWKVTVTFEGMERETVQSFLPAGQVTLMQAPSVLTLEPTARGSREDS